MPRRPVPANEAPPEFGRCHFCTRPVLSGRYYDRSCQVRHAWFGCRPESVRWRAMSLADRKAALRQQLTTPNPERTPA